eukprot:gene6056-6670_t
MTGRDVNWRTGINLVDPDTGLTPLMLAAIQGKQPIAQVLLERGAEVDYKESRKGRTALHIAARSGQVAVAVELLKRDAAVNATDRFLKTPLMHAAKGGYLDCVKALLARGAGVNMTDEKGFSPLHYAARFGHYQVVQALAAAGAALEIRDELDGKTALHWAAQFGRKETVLALLDLGAKVNRRASKDKVTALMLASREGFKSIISILIQRKADANMTDLFGWTALHFAASWGRRDSAHLLIVDGFADLNARAFGQDKSGGIPPLIVAAKGGHVEVMKVLLHYGANVDLCELAAHESALACASALGLCEVMQCLIDYGARVNIQNEVTGSTPLMAAAGAGRRGAIVLLLDHLADMNILDRAGRTALEYAERNKYEEVFLSALLQVSASAKVNLLPWLEVQLPHLKPSYGEPSVFLSSLLYRKRGLFFGLYQLTGDCDVYLVYGLVMIAAACRQAIVTHPRDRPHLSRHLAEVERMLLCCLRCRELCRDEIFTDVFIMGTVPCGALGPHYRIDYLASALVTGPLALYLDQGLTSLLAAEEVSEKIDRLFFACLREVGEEVDGYGSACGPLLRLRYCPAAMLLLGIAGDLVLLALLAYYTTYLSSKTGGGGAGRLSALEGVILAGSVARLLHAIGLIEEKRWAVSPSVIVRFAELEKMRWRKIYGHFLETPWHFLDLCTVCLSLAGSFLLLVQRPSDRLRPHPSDPATQLLAVACVPLSLSLLRYPAALSRSLGLPLVTVSALAADLSGILLLLAALGLGFGLVFYALFRDDVDSFRSVERTIATLFSAVLKQFDPQLFVDSSRHLLGDLLGGLFLLLTVGLAFNAVIGIMSARFQQVRLEVEGWWQRERCLLLQQNLLVLEKSPLAMLPAPFNLFSSLFYIPHVFVAWRSRLARDRRTAPSIAGQASDAFLLLLLLFPAAVVEYCRIYLLSPIAGWIAKAYYLAVSPLGILHAACCLFVKHFRDPAPRLLIKSRLTDGRLRLSYGVDRDYYEAQALSRFEDQRLHRPLEQFANPLFTAEAALDKEVLRRLKEAAYARGFMGDEAINAQPLAHRKYESEGEGGLSILLRKWWQRKRKDDFEGRDIRIAPISAYLQLANIQDIEDIVPPGLQTESFKKSGALPSAERAAGDNTSLLPEQSSTVDVVEANQQFYTQQLDVLGTIPGNNSLAYASQYDQQRVSDLPAAKPGIWWIAKKPTSPNKRFFQSSKSAHFSGAEGEMVTMSPYQPGILSADQWQELAQETEPQNAHITSNLLSTVSRTKSKSQMGTRNAYQGQVDEGQEEVDREELDLPTNSAASALAVPSFYFPAQRFPPIFLPHERKKIFEEVLPDVFHDDFTHAIETSERNFSILELRLQNLEGMFSKQLSLLQQIAEQQENYKAQPAQLLPESTAEHNQYSYY